MKKWNLLSVLFALAIAFTACDKDDEPSGNYMTYDGKTYKLVIGALEEHGGNNFDITLGYKSKDDGYGGVFFELFTSTSSLSNGKFTFSDAYDLPAECFSDASYVHIAETDTDDYFTEGTVQIKISRNDKYEINFNGITETGKKVKGYYNGELEYYDQR